MVANNNSGAGGGENKKKSKKGCPVNSTIPGLPMGDERRCLNQIRKQKTINKEFRLWNGVPAGDFAISYVLCSQIKRRRKDATVESMFENGAIPQTVLDAISSAAAARAASPKKSKKSAGKKEKAPAAAAK